MSIILSIFGFLRSPIGKYVALAMMLVAAYFSFMKYIEYRDNQIRDAAIQEILLQLETSQKDNELKLQNLLLDNQKNERLTISQLEARRDALEQARQKMYDIIQNVDNADAIKTALTLLYGSFDVTQQ